MSGGSAGIHPDRRGERAPGVGSLDALAQQPCPRSPVKVGFITLGCDKNTVDSERYLAQLADRGAEYTEDMGEADVIVVNTCGFIDAAKKESIDALVEAGRLKERG